MIRKNFWSLESFPTGAWDIFSLLPSPVCRGQFQVLCAHAHAHERMRKTSKESFADSNSQANTKWFWNSRMHSIESAVIIYTIIITCFSQVSSLTLARGQALTAGVTRGLTVRQQVRQSDTTEAHTMNIIISVPQVPTPSRSSYWH